MKRRFDIAFKFGNNSIRQGLSQLDSPLIERIDVPYHTLGEHAVLIQGNQASERSRAKAFRHNRICRTIALKRAMRDQMIRDPVCF